MTIVRNNQDGSLVDESCGGKKPDRSLAADPFQHLRITMQKGLVWPVFQPLLMSSRIMS